MALLGHTEQLLFKTYFKTEKGRTYLINTDIQRQANGKNKQTNKQKNPICSKPKNKVKPPKEDLSKTEISSLLGKEFNEVIPKYKSTKQKLQLK